MCGCAETFVCSRCVGTPHDWRYWHDEPKTPEEEAYQRLGDATAVAVAGSGGES